MLSPLQMANRETRTGREAKSLWVEQGQTSDGLGPWDPRTIPKAVFPLLD